MEGNEVRAKFVENCDKALATMVLAMEPCLLYLTGNDPIDCFCLESTVRAFSM